jgi:ATP-binding cassette subfamily G (WHITE) protein 2 (SNQ2)
MPMQMMGRPIIKKQTGYGFYRPAAVQIANTLADMPFSATRILIYDIVIYFMSHLARSAGGFFTFHLVNYVAFLAMQGFFRTIGLFCSNYHTAIRVAVAIFPNLALYAGYMIPINQMRRWLFWVVRFQFLAAKVLPVSHCVLPVLHKSGQLCMVRPHGE